MRRAERWQRLGRLLPVCLGAALLAGPAWAFLIQTFEGPGGRVHQAWRDPEQVPFMLHYDGCADLTQTVTWETLRGCFAVWDSVATARVGFVDQFFPFPPREASCLDPEARR